MRNEGKVYGHSKGAAPGSKQWYKQVAYRSTWSGSLWDQFCRMNMQSTWRILQVCTGASREGYVRIDNDPKAPEATLIADALKLPLADKSFDMSLCDPPYDFDYPRRIRLQRELFRVTRRRVIFKAPWIPRGTGWRLREDLLTMIGSHTCANVAVLSVLDAPPDKELFS